MEEYIIPDEKKAEVLKQLYLFTPVLTQLSEKLRDITLTLAQFFGSLMQSYVKSVDFMFSYPNHQYRNTL